jgi:hypothetical protein
MIGVAVMSPLLVRQMGRSLMISAPLIVFAFDFVSLLVTYLVLTPIAPAVLGDVAGSPARFAAWITLVKLPMMLAHLLAGSWRTWTAMMTRGEAPDPPVRTGRRHTLAKVLHLGADVAWSVIAALIVFTRVADPGDAHLWLLVAVTAVGPFLVPRAVSGPVRLLRWWWRRRRARPAPDHPGLEATGTSPTAVPTRPPPPE